MIGLIGLVNDIPFCYIDIFRNHTGAGGQIGKKRIIVRRQG